MRIGVDLLWVRPGICGGTESAIRNLLDGFGEYDTENEYVLFVAKDNAHTFRHYEKDSRINLRICDVRCAYQPIRILWENLFLDKLAGKVQIDVMYIPVYSMPRKHGSGVRYVCAIHDLQALHYPQYFSAIKRLFLRQAWRYTCRKADRVVTGSEYCKNDLEAVYPMVRGRVKKIYDVVTTHKTDEDFESIAVRYRLQREGYDYCVSAMLPHKNLYTLLQAIKRRKEQGDSCPLVLSGVGGQSAVFEETVKKLGIEDAVINTGYVSNEERDCLYENCRMFLFPSVFEGFGMTPIEAMRRGKRVVMTKESCLEEITQGKAVYVDSPYDPEDWLRKMNIAMKIKPQKQRFEQYEVESVVREYLEMFREL